MIVAYGLFGFGYVITATFLVQLVRTNPAILPLEPYVWLIVGLSAVLSGRAGLDSIQRIPGLLDLSVLPAGETGGGYSDIFREAPSRAFRAGLPGLVVVGGRGDKPRR